MPRWLAIDQGTTSTKACCGRPGGAIEPVGSRRHRQIRPRPGWVEHDPSELLENIRQLVAEAGAIDAMALSHQGETVVAWDGLTKRPIANAIVWQDERTGPALERMRSEGLETVVQDRAGLKLDPYFSASKLRWLLDHAPQASALRRAGRLRLGTSDAFFLDALTGRFITDLSTASRTSLLDLRRLCWDETLCDLFGVPRECLPEILPTTGWFGDLADGVPVVASAVDQQAALYGHGCTKPGDLKITFGTGAFALGLVDGPPMIRAGGGLLPTIAWQQGETVPQYALDGGMFTAGAAVEWLQGVGLLQKMEELDTLPGQTAASRGVFFVPALAGLGCPHWDREARGGWVGLGLDTSRAVLVAAVLEGIAFRAAELVDAFGEARGTAPSRISIDGGLTRSVRFARLLADALGRAIEVAGDTDLTALGLLQFCSLRAGMPPVLAGSWRRVEPEDGTSGRAAARARFSEAIGAVRGVRRSMTA